MIQTSTDAVKNSYSKLQFDCNENTLKTTSKTIASFSPFAIFTSSEQKLEHLHENEIKNFNTKGTEIKDTINYNYKTILQKCHQDDKIGEN